MKPKPKVRVGWLSQLLFVLSLIFLGLSLFSLGWAVWPAPMAGVQFAIPAGVLPGAPAGTTYASLADYTLDVSWPRWIRAGETGTIVVELSSGESDEALSEDRIAQVVLVEPEILALPVDPPGRMQASLAPGQTLSLSWQVEGILTGQYPGKLNVGFGFYDDILAELVPVPVAVVDMSIRVTALWGLEAGLVIWLGVVGLVLWGVLFILGRLAEK